MDLDLQILAQALPDPFFGRFGVLVRQPICTPTRVLFWRRLGAEMLRNVGAHTNTVSHRTGHTRVGFLVNHKLTELGVHEQVAATRDRNRRTIDPGLNPS